MTALTSLRRRTAIPAALAATALFLTGCSTDNNAATDDNAGTATEAQADEHDGHGHAGEEESDAVEVDSAQPRLVATYDGGFVTLDAHSLEIIEDTELSGFNRVNAVGDGRHVFISTSSGFQLFDTGAWTVDHGDHGHYYAGSPQLTDTIYQADTPGHVVPHAGQTVLFDDGDGSIEIFDTESFLDDSAPTPENRAALEPHHGVAVALENGDLLYTLGDEDERVGAVVVDPEDNEIARSEDCDAVHGEATSKDEAIGLGCTDGVLIYKDGAFDIIDSPDGGRTGTLVGSDASTVLLGNHQLPDDEEHTSVALIDTANGTFTVVELPAPYSSRSLARGPEGEALVLGTDGVLYVIDPRTGEITNSHQIIQEWDEPEDWQEPRATVHVLGDRAYVSDPDKSELHVVDLADGSVLTSTEVPHTLNEFASVTG